MRVNPAHISFDMTLLANLKQEAGFLWLLSWRYRSNWRILHIDGFETGRRIPMSMGESRQFFQYSLDKPENPE